MASIIIRKIINKVVQTVDRMPLSSTLKHDVINKVVQTVDRASPTLKHDVINGAVILSKWGVTLGTSIGLAECVCSVILPSQYQERHSGKEMCQLVGGGFLIGASLPITLPAVMVYGMYLALKPTSLITAKDARKQAQKEISSQYKHRYKSCLRAIRRNSREGKTNARCYYFGNTYKHMLKEKGYRVSDLGFYNIHHSDVWVSWGEQDDNKGTDTMLSMMRYDKAATKYMRGNLEEALRKFNKSSQQYRQRQKESIKKECT